MRHLPLIFSASVALFGSSRSVAQDAAHPAMRVRVTTPEIKDVADWRLAALDEKPGDEVFVVTVGGVLETLALSDRKSAPVRAKSGLVQDPTHCVLAFDPLQKGARSRLFVASQRGVERYDPDATGSLSAAPQPIAPRTKLRMRTGRPTFAPLVQDVNGDGMTDLIVPNGSALEVWIQTVSTGDAQERTFVKAATVQVRTSSNESMDADDLSDNLESSILIPSLKLSDVNGDGRPDLLVEDGQRRAFHLVRADGVIPPLPDVTVDLSTFRDTTARGEIALGRTLAGSDRAVYESRDLDGDSIPDAVIAQGRKVWVFRGTKDGPQFTEPSNVLKAADDITAVLVLNLDQDDKPDLLLVRIQVPSLGTLLRGLVSSWEVEMNAVGYQNTGGGKFDTAPKWKNTITFQAPSILSIVKEPEKLLARFEGVGRKFRSPAEGDFDGDGKGDVALVSEDGTSLDVWRGDAQSVRDTARSNDEVLRRVLFEDENSTWDIERILAWLSSFGEQRVAQITGGKAPDVRFPLRSAAAWRLASLAPGDVDGDGRMELVLAYEAVEGESRMLFDLVEWN